MRFLLAALAAFFCLGVSAQTPQPPEVAARAYLLLDATSNQILAAKDPDMAVEPASLTKLMTAYLVFDALRSKKLDLKQTLPVSERAWKILGSRMFIAPKTQVPVEDLIKGMVVQSGNDATMALAEGVGGSAERFVQMMNDQAKALGMRSTGYKNPEGLTEAGHTTTARDLGILATRLMADFPDYVGFYATKKYHYPGAPPSNDSNSNLLLFRDPTVDGLTTGYTDTAGYCMVATAKRDFTSVPVAGAPAVTGNRRLLAIVLGAANENARANESQKLLNWGFTAYEAVKLFDAEQAVVTANVWKGAQSSVKLGRHQPILVAVPAGSAAKLKTQVVRTDPLVAPLGKDQPVGSLKVLAGDQPVAEVPLLALDAVEQAGILGRAWDAVRLWIR
jgi:D-alanyl-D-alanine carboxypeptidase (penicillin-binding protein 5/6)